MKSSTEQILKLDAEAEVARIQNFIKNSLIQLKRRGLVVAVSGGIDSALCLSLAVTAIGAEKVTALLMPESQSAASSLNLGKTLCDQLGVQYHVIDISDTLEAIGCYRAQDQAIREVFPDYKAGSPFKLVMVPKSKITHYNLVIEQDNKQLSRRCPAPQFRHLIAATNHKQRIRKANEYFYAEKDHYAVIGTPNLLELALGFFVKAGDGIADIKPIAHLFKTQVYQLAAFVSVPEAIYQAAPTTDTFSLGQSQEEFFFRVPYATMDLALWALRSGKSPESLANIINMPIDQASQLIEHIRHSQRSAYYQTSSALMLATNNLNIGG